MASNLKRKQTENPTCTCASLQNRPSNPSYSQKCHCCCCKQTHLPSLADTCQNFLKSKLPEKIMLYKQNEWSLFPETALKVLINGFKNEKSSVVVFTDGQTLRVDFLSMTAVNLKTLKQRSISWIDESGKCFFPPLFIDQESDSSCSRSDPVTKTPKIRKTRKKEIENNQEIPSTTAILKKKIKLVDPKSQVYNSIQASFSYGMGRFGQTSKIVHVHRYEPDDELAKWRFGKFEKNRKDNNEVMMRYAWFGCGKQEMARVLIHGFADRPGMKMLTFMPADRAFSSVNQCDVDEKCGVQYMLLCRVIPNIPPQAGILRPKYYSISSLYSDSYIHPEYLLSFKLPPLILEYLMGLNGIWLSEPPPVTSFIPLPVLPTCHAVRPVRAEKSKEPGPVSPWLGFVNLFEAIQRDLSPIAKELLLHHYDQFRRKEITREELVKKIRVIVGDKILKTTLTKLQRSPSSWYDEPIRTAKPVSGICDSMTALRAVPPGGSNQESQPRGSSCSPLVLALVNESRMPDTNHGGASDSVSGTSRAESAKKCIDQEKAVEGRSSSEPGTSRGGHSKNLIAGKVPYYTIEQGMQLNNAAIDSILRAAKLDPGP
ncbi:hypothetical protein LUZ60_000258 [Juncus effusus]|nr:hypothetical protein LUZ60_000258 [Juncus effusus]